MTYKQWKAFKVEFITGIKCTHNYTFLHSLVLTCYLALLGWKYSYSIHRMFSSILVLVYGNCCSQTYNSYRKTAIALLEINNLCFPYRPLEKKFYMIFFRNLIHACIS